MTGEARATGRGAATRVALLDAAREAFVERGYASAAISDVVRRAGTSVGSLYHHFDGKVDLYRALFDDFAERRRQSTRAAVHRARDTGRLEPLALFAIGARAFLEGCWEEREQALLFLTGSSPAGFDELARRAFSSWTADNRVLLGASPGPAGEALVTALTGTIREAGRVVVALSDRAAATAFIDEIVALVAKLGRE